MPINESLRGARFQRIAIKEKVVSGGRKVRGNRLYPERGVWTSVTFERNRRRIHTRNASRNYIFDSSYETWRYYVRIAPYFFFSSLATHTNIIRRSKLLYALPLVCNSINRVLFEYFFRHCVCVKSVGGWNRRNEARGRRVGRRK